jgi:hypothetical protein
LKHDLETLRKQAIDGDITAANKYVTKMTGRSIGKEISIFDVYCAEIVALINEAETNKAAGELKHRIVRLLNEQLRWEPSFF